MSILHLYDPDICDGDYCPKDCDRCEKGERIEAGEDMKDLIEREAAIDMIDAIFPVDPTKSEYAQGIACGAALAKTYIRQLPSVQPEIVRCKDCKHYDARRDECHNIVWGDGWANYPSPTVYEDDFCSHAERRTDE